MEETHLFKVRSEIKYDDRVANQDFGEHYILATSEGDGLATYIDYLNGMRALEDTKSVRFNIEEIDLFNISPKVLEILVKESKK